MAITVGDRIQSMINHMDKGEIELGLSDVCIAVDITSKKYFGQDKSSRTHYKNFLSENMWIILMTGMGSLISEDIKLPFKHQEIKSDADGYCTLQDIIYHIMRCEYVHGTGDNSKIIWNNRISLALDPNGNLLISPTFIWGLALTVIVCEVNKDEKVQDTSWISTASFKYLINDLWGKRDSLKSIAKCMFNIEFS